MFINILSEINAQNFVGNNAKKNVLKGKEKITLWAYTRSKMLIQCII